MEPADVVALIAGKEKYLFLIGPPIGAANLIAFQRIGTRSGKSLGALNASVCDESKKSRDIVCSAFTRRLTVPSSAGVPCPFWQTARWCRA